MNNPPDSARQQLEHMLSYYQTQMIYVAVKLGIPDLLAGRPRSAAELAPEVHAHPGALFRLMRALASLGIFSQDEQDKFALTELSRLLCAATPGSLRPFALSYGEPWWWSTWGDLLHSVQTGENAFNHVHGTSLFEFLSHNPEAATIFNDNMTSMTAGEVPAILAAADFSGVKLLVDVGGGEGMLVGAVLQAYPETHAIVFDLPGTAPAAFMQASGVADRCKMVGGNFFESIPAGGDAYVLKDILHDWEDEKAILILRNIRQAISGSGRLMVIERVIRTGKEYVTACLIDINMLVMSGGRERTLEEYRALLAAGGFRLSRTIPTGTATDILEALPDEI